MLRPLRRLLSIAAIVVVALGAQGCRDVVKGTIFDANGLAGDVNAQSGPTGDQPTGTALFGYFTSEAGCVSFATRFGG
jgi:hypothetical protein